MPDTNITCDLPPYERIQPPPIISKPPRAMYLYVWETDIGVCNEPPLRDDIVAIQGGYLQVVQIVDGKAFYYSESQETPVETAIDYGDYHSVETPF